MNKSTINIIGKSFLIDLKEVSDALISNHKLLETKLRLLAKKFNTTILKWESHNFSPQGFTGFLLLKESHLSIHTWPEKSYIAIDFFTCGIAPEKSLVEDEIIKLFSPKFVNIEEISRG